MLGTLRNGADIVVAAGQRVALATTETLQEIRCALRYARTSATTLPIGTVVVDHANGLLTEAVTLVEIEQLTEDLDDLLANSVTLIVHRDIREIGSKRESHLLSLVDGQFRRFATLGTSESDAALEEFSRKSAKSRKRDVVELWRGRR